MNVVYACNDAYAIYAGVSMYSLMDQNQHMEQINVYIFSMKLTQASKEKLQLIAQTFHRKISFIEIGEIKEQLGFYLDTAGYSDAILARLFIGRLLPASVERIIYFDCDIVIHDSLQDLWDTKLGDCVLAGVPEFNIHPKIREDLGLDDTMPYFNSGMLVIDVHRWREENIEAAILENAKLYNGKLNYVDQDLINLTLKGRIKILPTRYNFAHFIRYFPYRYILKITPSYAAITEEEVRLAIERPAVIHFLGDQRPWFRGNHNPYQKYYDHYLALTPWAGTPKIKGKELYMMCFVILNGVTRVWPGFRVWFYRNIGSKKFKLFGKV